MLAAARLLHARCAALPLRGLAPRASAAGESARLRRPRRGGRVPPSSSPPRRLSAFASPECPCRDPVAGQRHSRAGGTCGLVGCACPRAAWRSSRRGGGRRAKGGPGCPRPLRPLSPAGQEGDIGRAGGPKAVLEGDLRGDGGMDEASPLASEETTTARSQRRPVRSAVRLPHRRPPFVVPRFLPPCPGFDSS